MKASTALHESNTRTELGGDTLQTQLQEISITSIENDENTRAKWSNFSNLVKCASKELTIGQMIHVKQFSLLEAMSALELMDKKMDSGMVIHGNSPQTIVSRLEKKEIPLEFESALDVIATIDRIISCEASWLSGQPLLQTLLTCLYLHKETILQLLQKFMPFESLSTLMSASTALENVGLDKTSLLSLVFGVFALLTIKIAHIVRADILRADIYEEEDFSMDKHNSVELGLLGTINDDVLVHLMTVAIERLEAALAISNSWNNTNNKKGSKKKNGSHGGKKALGKTATMSNSLLLHSDPQISTFLCEALLRRLHLRITLYQGYRRLNSLESPEQLPFICQNFCDAEKIFRELLTEQLEWDLMSSDSLKIGREVGFDISISRLYSSSSPPRTVTLLPIGQALQIHLRISTNMRLITAPDLGEWKNMEDFRLYLQDFSRRCPSIVPRSYVVLLMFCDTKIYGMYNFLDWHTGAMTMSGVPSVLLESQEGVNFSTRTIDIVYESVKLYLFNRSRQRSRIESLLEEWAILQKEAASIDEEFITQLSIPKVSYPRYLSAWALEEAVIMMTHYLKLGLEVELYSPSEYPTIYWYLDYLEGSRLQNLKFTWSFVEKMRQVMQNRPCAPPSVNNSNTAQDSPAKSNTHKSTQKRSKKGKKKQQHTKQPEENANFKSIIIDPTKYRFEREITFSEISRTFFRAYFQMCFAIEQANLLPPSNSKCHGSSVIRFSRRFACFQSLLFPSPLTYDEFLQHQELANFQVDLIFESADECFRSAATLAEQKLKELGITQLDMTVGTNMGEKNGNLLNEVLPASLDHIYDLKIIAKIASLNSSKWLDKKGLNNNALRHAKSGGKGHTSALGKSEMSSITSKTKFIEFDFTLHPHFPITKFPHRLSHN